MLTQRLLAASFLVLIGALTTEAQIPLNSSESVVVLRNGSILRGHVTSLGDIYLVSLGETDRVRVPADRVEMVCHDLEEAYRQKREQVGEADARGHLRLADWCLRHKLTARAADQILAAAAWSPGHPSVLALHRQLLSSAHRETEATTELPTAPPQRAASPTTGLSPESVQAYTAAVQPLLMNRCATGACHGTGSPSQLKLLRPPMGHLIHSRLTQRNLREVLQYVDRGAPETSELLTVPQRPHGGLTEPVIAPTDAAQLQTLIDWIRMLKGKSAKKSETGPTGEPNVLMHPSPNAVPTFQPPPEATPNPTSEFTPRDEFDPELFNRRRD